MLSKNPSTTSAWNKLKGLQESNSSQSIGDLFEENAHRFAQFSTQFEDILFDYSKNNVTDSVMESLVKLAKECNLTEQLNAMFEGEQINFTEDRSVLHTALRAPFNNAKENESIRETAVRTELEKMHSFSDQFRNGALKGFSGKTIDTVVNIGVGGSDLGPLMVVEALKGYIPTHLKIHFISNIDGSHLTQTLKEIDIETTLFLVASKTFGTQETMTNAHSVRAILIQHFESEQAIPLHFAAMSTHSEKVKEFGILPNRVFTFWDWVGGRFSLWSSIGLSISMAVGYVKFRELLNGAHAMDIHFKETEFKDNLPVLMGLISIWNVNFCGYTTEAILPYVQGLHRFHAYLQQLGMESNGKSIDRQGKRISYATSPVIWGGAGTNGQHSYFQLLHQGTQKIPCDFIAVANNSFSLGDHHSKLMANFFAQSEGLMKGWSDAEVLEQNPGISESLVPFKCFEGGVPTNSILIKELTPYNLGALIAMYEHKTFVLGAIWNINSFDQMGVELGKKLAQSIISELDSSETVKSHDSSTNGLINQFKSFRD